MNKGTYICSVCGILAYPMSHPFVVLTNLANAHQQAEQDCHLGGSNVCSVYV